MLETPVHWHSTETHTWVDPGVSMGLDKFVWQLWSLWCEGRHPGKGRTLTLSFRHQDHQEIWCVNLHRSLTPAITEKLEDVFFIQKFLRVWKGQCKPEIVKSIAWLMYLISKPFRNVFTYKWGTSQAKKIFKVNKMYTKTQSCHFYLSIERHFRCYILCIY